MSQTIAIERVDHIGVRVRDLDRALDFYWVLGFTLARRAEGDDVAIIRNAQGVELNLVFNANAGDPGANVLMDVPEKFPGYTHIALRVASIPAALAALRANDIPVTQGPVSFGESGQVSVFVRDPDRNVIELRGRDQGAVEGVTRLRTLTLRRRPPGLQTDAGGYSRSIAATSSRLRMRAYIFIALSRL
jgi:lactoylglutathione lyase